MKIPNSGQLTRKLLQGRGYTLLNTQYMPCGISLERDISKDTPLGSLKTVFDVGANKGIMALYFEQQFPNATIQAFEPIASTFEVLKQNTQSHPRIKLHQIGFSDESGTAEIFLQSDHGLNSLNNAVNVPDPKMKGQSETITLDTVNHFSQTHKIDRIDLLKTDAEGLDLKIMQGASALIEARKVRYILSEVGFSEDNTRNTPFEALRSYLYERGYKLRGFYDQSDFGGKPYMTCANALFLLQD